MRTGKWRDHGIALGVVLAWHILLGWVLVRALRIEPSRNDEDALQIVYVTVPASALPSTAHVARIPAARQQYRPRPEPVHAGTANLRASAAPQPVDAPSLSAVFLDQAHTWAQQQAPIDFASHDPLASRPKQLPVAATKRFRMKPQHSPRDLVAAVGGYLFAPKGYNTDPCPRNRENIGNLMAGQDSQALQQELDFEREHCRP